MACVQRVASMIDPVRTQRRYLVVLAASVVAIAMHGCSPSTSTLPAVVGVRARVDTTYYEAEGRGRREWLASMRTAARQAGVPAPYLAYTSSQTRWSYASAKMTPRGCTPSLPLVELTVRYTMPRLVRDSAVAEEDVREWRRYLVSLWRHEEGHAIRAMRESAEVRDSLIHARAPSCSVLGPSMSRAQDAVRRKHRALQVRYDSLTRHGASQGALFILPGVTQLSVDTTYRDTMP